MDPQPLIFGVVVALLLGVPLLVVAGAWLAFTRLRNRILRAIAGATLGAVIFAPAYLSVHPIAHGRHLEHAPLPAPLAEALWIHYVVDDATSFDAAIVVPVLVAAVVIAAIAIVRPLRWPDRWRAVKRLFALSFAGPALMALALIVQGVVLSGFVAGPLMWAATCDIGWSLLLLHRTRRSQLEAGSERWALRAWLIACAAMGAFGAVADFGIGVATT